jgi:hypothetical protein
MQRCIMHRFLYLVLFLGFAWLPTNRSCAADFHLTDGTDLVGELASATDEGFVIRLTTGIFSPRIPWSRLSQETLKALATDPKSAEFVEPYIETPPDEKAKRKAIEIKPVPRIDRPEGRISLFAAFSTPIGLAILLVLIVANVFAGYEIALFRHQPVLLVCAVSLVLPLIGPIIFLASPAREVTHHAEEPGPLPADQFATSHPSVAGLPESGAASTSSMKSKITSMFKRPSSGGLTLAQHQKPGAKAEVETKTWRRGDSTFNRRFFETQFAGFFRVVPGEAEKDLVMVVKAGRNEYVAKRISRITANEMGLQLLSGGEVQVPFAELQEIQVRHKDAKG